MNQTDEENHMQLHMKQEGGGGVKVGNACNDVRGFSMQEKCVVSSLLSFYNIS